LSGFIQYETATPLPTRSDGGIIAGSLPSFEICGGALSSCRIVLRFILFAIVATERVADGLEFLKFAGHIWRARVLCRHYGCNDFSVERLFGVVIRKSMFGLAGGDSHCLHPADLWRSV